MTTNSKIVKFRKKSGRLVIQETPVIRGEYAEQIIAEVLRMPSAEAIERNRKARELLRQLRK